MNFVEVRDYIGENYCNKITVKELAEQMHMSVRNFSRFFSEGIRVATGNLCDSDENKPRIRVIAGPVDVNIGSGMVLWLLGQQLFYETI